MISVFPTLVLRFVFQMVICGQFDRVFFLTIVMHVVVFALRRQSCLHESELVGQVYSAGVRFAESGRQFGPRARPFPTRLF